MAGAGVDPLIKAIEAVDVATGQMNRVPDVGVFETNLTFVSHDRSFRVLAFGVTNWSSAVLQNKGARKENIK